MAGGFVAGTAAFAFLLTGAINGRWSQMGKKSCRTQDQIDMGRVQRKEAQQDECEARESNDGPVRRRLYGSVGNCRGVVGKCGCPMPHHAPCVAPSPHKTPLTRLPPKAS